MNSNISTQKLLRDCGQHSVMISLSNIVLHSRTSLQNRTEHFPSSHIELCLLSKPVDALQMSDVTLCSVFDR